MSVTNIDVASKTVWFSNNLRYTQHKSVLKNLLSIGNIDKMAIVADFFFSIHFDVLYLCLVDGVLPLYKMDKHYKRMEHFLICQVYCALLRATYISTCQTGPAVWTTALYPGYPKFVSRYESFISLRNDDAMITWYRWTQESTSLLDWLSIAGKTAYNDAKMTSWSRITFLG